MRMFACVVFSVVAVSVPAAGATRVIGTVQWATFRNVHGWSIRYPRGWQYFSCRQCPDPTKVDGYVMFTPRSERPVSSVVVERLQDRPPRDGADTWLAEVEHAANQNRLLHEETTSVNGLPARTVRYLNNGVNQELEATYIIDGVRTFEIAFDAAVPGKHLEDVPEYRIYQAMRASFAVAGPAR